MSTTTSTLTSVTTTATTATVSSTTTSITATTTTTLDSLSVFFVVEHVDYTKLINHRSLRTNFIATVAAEVAQKAGVSTSYVSVTLHPGSVGIHSKILLPPGMTAAAVAPAIEQQSPNMTGKLVTSFSGLRDWFMVVTGEVTIGTPQLVALGEVSTTTTSSSTITGTRTITATSTTTTTAPNVTSTQDPSLVPQEQPGQFSIFGLPETTTAAVGGSVAVVLVVMLIVVLIWGIRYCRRGPRKSFQGASTDYLDAKLPDEEQPGSQPAADGGQLLQTPGGASVRQPESELGVSPAASSQARYQQQFGHGQAIQEHQAQPFLRPPPVTGVEEGPGLYRIIVEHTAVGPTLALGDVVEELAAGELVEVLEVVPSAEFKRLRARIRSPPGWISIRSLEDGDSRRWADRVRDHPTPSAASRTLSPQSAGAGGAMTVHGGTGMVPGSGSMFPAGAGKPPMLPGMRPMMPGGMMPPAGMAPPGVAPWAAVPQMPTPGVGLAPPGFNMQPVSPHPSGMAQSSMGSIFSASSAPLPGGFFAGDRVQALVDFSGAGGRVSAGEEGVVAGPCKGLDSQRAADRVNCRFPRHPNINLKVSQIRKVGTDQV